MCQLSAQKQAVLRRIDFRTKGSLKLTAFMTNTACDSYFFSSGSSYFLPKDRRWRKRSWKEVLTLHPFIWTKLDTTLWQAFRELQWCSQRKAAPWPGLLAVVSLLQETHADQDRLYNKSVLQHVSSLWGCFCYCIILCCFVNVFIV